MRKIKSFLVYCSEKTCKTKTCSCKLLFRATGKVLPSWNSWFYRRNFQQIFQKHCNFVEIGHIQSFYKLKIFIGIGFWKHFWELFWYGGTVSMGRFSFLWNVLKHFDVNNHHQKRNWNKVKIYKILHFRNGLFSITEHMVANLLSHCKNTAGHHWKRIQKF